MKRLAQILSFLALAATLLPAVLFFADKITLPETKFVLLVGTVLWFLTAPFWMEHKTSE